MPTEMAMGIMIVMHKKVSRRTRETTEHHACSPTHLRFSPCASYTALDRTSKKFSQAHRQASDLLAAVEATYNNLLLTPKRLLQSSDLFDYPLLRLQQVVTPPAN